MSDWNENSGVSAYVSGPSTLKALDKIAKGVPVEEAGVTGTTNGAAMKIAPIGIVSDYREMQNLIKNVYQICLPTHNTKIAIAALQPLPLLSVIQYEEAVLLMKSGI